MDSKGASKLTYMSNVLKNKLMDMAAERMAEKRKTDQMSVSLDAPISEDDETAIIDNIADKLTEDLTSVMRVICLTLPGGVALCLRHWVIRRMNFSRNIRSQ